MTTRKKKKKSTSSKKVRAGRRRRGPDGLTAIQRQFLAALLELHEVKASAEAIGIDRHQHYRDWLKEEAYREEYEKLIADVEKIRADEVAREIRHRGVDGYNEEVIEEKLIPHPDNPEEMIRTEIKRKRVKKWSVPCLLWEGNRLWGNPSRFEVTGADGGAIEHKVSVEMFRQAAGLE